MTFPNQASFCGSPPTPNPDTSACPDSLPIMSPFSLMPQVFSY